MNESERIEYLIEVLCAGNQAEFGRRASITASVVNKLLKGEMNLSDYYITKICKAFSDLNPQFLRDGISYPGDISVQVVRAKYEQEISRLISEAEEWKAQASTMRKAMDKLLGKI